MAAVHQLKKGPVKIQKLNDVTKLWERAEVVVLVVEVVVYFINTVSIRQYLYLF